MSVIHNFSFEVLNMRLGKGLTDSLNTALKTTENYLASFEKEEWIKNAAFLTNFGG
jgi:hypothetical protein